MISGLLCSMKFSEEIIAANSERGNLFFLTEIVEINIKKKWQKNREKVEMEGGEDDTETEENEGEKS